MTFLSIKSFLIILASILSYIVLKVLINSFLNWRQRRKAFQRKYSSFDSEKNEKLLENDFSKASSQLAHSSAGN